MGNDLLTKKILVVDNSKVITKIIQNFLAESGFEPGNIFRAETKNQAMMMLGLEKFDLITSAIHLSDSNGIDFLKEVRSNGDDKHRDTPFLIISADSKEDYLDDLKEFSGCAFLSKPFNQQQIKEWAHKALNCLEETPEEETGPSKVSQGKTEIEVPEKIKDLFSKGIIEAMEQYMADASPTKLKEDWELNGFFSSWVDLMDSENRVQLNLIINFPKKMASDIYETIFGEIDLEQVAGVVQELVNILGGIVKPKMTDFASEILELAYWDEEKPEITGSLNLDLGLPESKMGEGHTLDVELEGLPKFVLPFETNDEIFYLVVLFQKF